MLDRIKSQKLREVAQKAMREEIFTQINNCDGNITKAAMALGYDKPITLYRVMNRLGIYTEKRLVIVDRNGNERRLK